jgi:hypothetical protein
MFGYETALSLPLAVGSYVTLDTPDHGQYLGQVLTQEILVKSGPEYGIGMEGEAGMFVAKPSTSSVFRDRLSLRYIQGLGRLLGRFDKDTFVPTTDDDVFQEAQVSEATAQSVTRYFSSVTGGDYATLEIGDALHVDGQAPVLLRANGFDRHTFLCGQSGSGKTYALGKIIEQLLLETDLRIVILDSNSDFVNLDKPRLLSGSSEDEDHESVGLYREAIRQLQITRPKGLARSPSSPLHIMFSDLKPHEQEAVLKLNPLDDREECHQFWNTVIQLIGQASYSFSDVRSKVREYSISPEVEQIGKRIDNLRIAEWDIWCPTDKHSLIDLLNQEDWRCIVVDIGALPPPQNSIIAMAVLGHYWHYRLKREPVLIVIDEAHYICPQSPLSDFDSITAEHVIRIAGEGRKFGLYLLLATQRPGKVHLNAVSQCDNLALMRMNSQADLALIAEMFSQVSETLLNLYFPVTEM